MSLRQLINRAALAPEPTRRPASGDGLSAGHAWRFWVSGASLCGRPRRYMMTRVFDDCPLKTQVQNDRELAEAAAIGSGRTRSCISVIESDKKGIVLGCHEQFVQYWVRRWQSGETSNSGTWPGQRREDHGWRWTSQFVRANGTHDSDSQSTPRCDVLFGKCFDLRCRGDPVLEISWIDVTSEVRREH